MNGKRDFYRKAYLKGYPKKGSIQFPEPPSAPESLWYPILSAVPTVAMILSIIMSMKMSGNIPIYLIIMCIGFIASPAMTIARYISNLLKYQNEKEYWQTEIDKAFRIYNEESDKSRRLLKESFKFSVKSSSGAFVDSSLQYLEIADKMPPFLWNALSGDGDYAQGYIGTYNAETFFQAQISKGIKILDKECKNKWDEIQESIQKVVANTPFIYDFIKHPALGICGNYRLSSELINSLVINMAIRHGYDCMKIALISNKENLEKNYSYIKWLPHIWNSKNTRRMIALCEEDIYELENEISVYYHLPQREKNNMFLLCIVDDSSYLERKPLLRWINEKRFGTFLFSVFQKTDKEDLPSSCEHFLCISDNDKRADYYDGEVISYEEDGAMKGIPVFYDSIEADMALKIARKLASVQIMDTENTSDIPSMVYFLENENISSVKSFPIEREWNIPVSEVSACIGTGAENRKIILNFSDGINIHMIVIGTSGSGKSQFLISMVLDMMLHYSADEVNFVFMDFKGNAFSSAFAYALDTLPERTLIYPNHVAGSVSNIESDGEYQITRIRILLKKEISKRESLLSRATEMGLIREARIDLYQESYRNNRMENYEEFINLPELFIIADEFMELLETYSSIVSEFSMIARKGRSLGIHLILSSQKMGGRLSPQISANAGTRICFRVIDPSDSNEMIGTDDAYYIDSGMFGRGYLKSGTLLQEFQSPLSETPYAEHNAPLFGEVNDYGRIIENDSEKKHGYDVKSGITERQAVIQKVCESQKHSENKAMVVTEPLPETLDLKKFLESIKFTSGIPVGKTDNIYAQCYDTAEIDFRKGNWTVQGVSRCGKTSLLEVLLISSAYYYNNSDSNYHFFICDLQSTELKKYCRLRNVSGTFINSIELLIRLIYRLNEEICNRKKHNADQRNIVVIIDNYDYIVEKYEYILPELSELFSRGSKYRIYFIVSHSERIAGYQSRSVDFYNKVVMMQKNESDYSNFMNLRDIKTIRRVTGRGFITGDVVLEMQTFTLPYGEQAVQDIISDINTGIKRRFEMKIETLPEILPSREFIAMLDDLNNTDSEKFYAGISSRDIRPVAISLSEKRYIAVTCSDTQVRTDFIRTMLDIHINMDIWSGKNILIITRNSNFKRNLLSDFDSEGIGKRFYSYQKGEPVPDFCLLDLCDISDFDEERRLLAELESKPRIVITENFPVFYDDLCNIRHEAFFQDFIAYLMNIYLNTVGGAWINCISEADLRDKSDFLNCMIEARNYAVMLCEDELKNIHLGLGQLINERNLISIDTAFSGISLPTNQAWLRENGKYSRILCTEE